MVWLLLLLSTIQPISVVISSDITLSIRTGRDCRRRRSCLVFKSLYILALWQRPFVSHGFESSNRLTVFDELEFMYSMGSILALHNYLWLPLFSR